MGNGEVILGAYHTYHTSGVLAQKIEQDLDLSLDSMSAINVKKVKSFCFGSKSQLCFLD